MSTADSSTSPAETIADAALCVPGVAELHGGQFGEVGTYLPNKRIVGVVVNESSCAVHISVKYPANVVAVAQQVRRAVEQVVDVPVTIIVGDLSIAESSRDEPASPDYPDKIAGPIEEWN